MSCCFFAAFFSLIVSCNLGSSESDDLSGSSSPIIPNKHGRAAATSKWPLKRLKARRPSQSCVSFVRIAYVTR